MTKAERPPRNYVPEYLREGYVAEETRQAMRRMAPHLKPIDSMLILWAPEARFDGAPRWPAETMLHRIIEQGAMGASQSGARPMLSAASYIEFADWAVSQLVEIQRRVVYAEYVQLSGWPNERKARHIGLSHSAWNRSLNKARDNIFTIFRIYARLLHIETLEK